MKNKIILLYILLNIVTGTAQINNEKYQHKKFISIRPQSYMFGANVGFETSLSKKWSLKTDVTSHFYYDYKNIAVLPTLKWYFQNEVGNGFHLNLKTFVGYFFNETPIKNKPYYTGGGIGIGWMKPFPNSNWYFCTNANIKIPFVFGNRPNSTPTIDENSDSYGFNMIYMYYLSPACALDINIGLAYRF